MSTRLPSWATPASVAAVASAVVAVHGQDPAPPRFNPGQQSTVRQTGQPAPNGRKPGAIPQYNGPPPIGNPAYYEQPQQPRPRLTQPVMAGPDGVRQVQATEPALPAGSGPRMEIVPPNGPETAVPPAVVQETVVVPGAIPTPEGVLYTETAPQVGGSPFPSPDISGGSVLPPAGPSGSMPSAPGLLPTPGMTQGMGTVVYTGNPLPAKQTPNVEVSMVAPESVGVGMPLTYELVVRNVGTVAVGNVRVEDELPVRGTLVATDPPAETAGDRLAWTVGTLEAGSERRIKVTMKLAEEGEIRSRATVSFASVTEARVRVTRPRVTVVVSAPETGTVRVGDKVPFEIRFTNSGSGLASQVAIQAEFSDGLFHEHGARIESQLSNLGAGETKTIKLSVTATKAGQQSCTIVAVADRNTPETARAAINLVEPRLVLRQTGPARCLVRSEPTFNLELSNPGTAATDPVTVWTIVPEGFDFVQASDGGMFNPSTKTVGWRLPGLPAGQAARPLALKVRATGPADGVFRTSAQASAGGNDPAFGGNTVTPVGMRNTHMLEAKAETVVKSEGVPALRFDVSSTEGVVEVGKEIVYEIRVVNQGTGPCTAVQVVADLADGTVIVGASGPSNARGGSGQQVVFDPMPQLGVKNDALYKVRVRGVQPGDMRFRVRLTCNEVRTPTVKEETTRFFKE